MSETTPDSTPETPADSSADSTSATRFADVPSGYPFPALEEQILDRWRRAQTFRRSVEKPAPEGPFTIYEGPPTANNKPHVGHVASRVAKDLFPRYRTMRGFHVPRKAGWDTHGLPVEIEVEKRLGFSGKEQIEEYGIAEFNRACLESVSTYEKQWRAMTERVGYWTDLDNAYFTYTNRYIESVWWALSTLWDQELLSRGYKIQPYCARCGTTLSSHEVAQNYKEADDPSVWVRFPVRAGQTIETVDGDSWEVPEGASLVAWTTTPWTLLAHVGLVAHADLVYRAVEDPTRPGEVLIFGDSLETPVPMDAEIDGKRRRLDLRDESEHPVVARFSGASLADTRYSRPFETTLDGHREALEQKGDTYDGPTDETGFYVTTSDYVTATDGTGLVHTAPLFGEDDYKTGQREGWPLLHTVDSEGRINPLDGIETFAGKDFKAVDPEIVRDLKERGLMLHSDRYLHNYPFCWRCDRPLLYYATESWFITTTKRKERLQELNRTIDWHPEHVGEGRFGNWLDNMVDWALSRKRYWGTPLPVWECDGCDHAQVPGSYADLFAAAGREMPDDPYDTDQFNPHRPYIDEMTWACGECESGTMTRVEEVIDAWFDSGAMPFAQHHYPFENRDLFDDQFPADYISEGVDQTRGWFYTLHALGGLLFDSVAYKHCIVLGHINDEDGRKMSKRLGNVVDPMEMMPETGADALRWYLCVNNPEVTARFSERLVREAAQGFLIPLWNALSFFTIYANLDGWRPSGEADGGRSVPFAERPALDRWVLLALDRLVEETTEHLDAYSIVDAARALGAFLDDLTNWYIRRSRDRFWAPGDDDSNVDRNASESGRDKAVEKESAYQSLYEVLTTYSRLIAPFTPFVADELHSRLVAGQVEGAADSVHLEDWPTPDATRREDDLQTAMAWVQRIVKFGHAARNTHNLKTRQPLASVTVVSADSAVRSLVAPFEDLIRDELNVKAIDWAEDRSAYVHHEVRPIYPKCGPRFGKQMKEVKAALEQANGEELAVRLEAGLAVQIEISTGAAELSPDELEVRLIEREGMVTEGDAELLVALETELDDDLIAEGLAREVINRIQTARKQAKLDYADRIEVTYSTSDDVAQVIDRFEDWIGTETLANGFRRVDQGLDQGEQLTDASIDQHPFRLSIETL